MIVVACPGQGSQTVGFLTPWLAESRFADRLAALSDAAGIDLAAHGTTSDADTIKDTAVAQPLIVAAGILTISALFADGRAERIGGVAGHSVGELTAAAAAGVLTEAEAVRFVRRRGVAMADAAARADTGMSAVLGGDEEDLLRRLADAGLAPANYNGGGQIVVAGATAALTELAADPPARARVVPLTVAGAFHTDYMAPAVPVLRAAAAELEPHDPRLPLWSNHDGERVDSGRRFLDLLVGQVSSPVRWDKCMESFLAAGVTGMIEVCPAGALTGLARRGMKGVPTVAVKTPDDLPAAFDLIDAQA